jgi:hypothetical protein
VAGLRHLVAARLGYRLPDGRLVGRTHAGPHGLHVGSGGVEIGLLRRCRLRALDRADREEGDIAEAKSVRLQEKIATCASRC